MVRVGSANISVRSQPSIGASLVGFLQPGFVVDVIVVQPPDEQNRVWYSVVYEEGEAVVRGWSAISAENFEQIGTRACEFFPGS